MALALRLDELVRTGQVASYSALASLGHVSRARISQMMNLLRLAVSPLPPLSIGASNAACGGDSYRVESTETTDGAMDGPHFALVALHRFQTPSLAPSVNKRLTPSLV